MSTPTLVIISDRARQNIPIVALPTLVMDDPGGPAYTAAYKQILLRGSPAILELGRTFDVTESFLLSHNDAERSLVHRWFSVLTSCIELMTHDEISRPLAALLDDSFALEQARVEDAPVDLLPAACRELREQASDPRVRSLALLAEVLAGRWSEREAEALCRELIVLDELCQRYYLDDGGLNPYYARSPALVWGGAVDRRVLPLWLSLTRDRFPASPPPVAEIRERLLRRG